MISGSPCAIFIPIGYKLISGINFILDNDVNEARDMAEEFTMPIHGENARESYERHVEGNCFNEGKVTAVTEERNITVELTKGLNGSFTRSINTSCFLQNAFSFN